MYSKVHRRFVLIGLYFLLAYPALAQADISITIQTSANSYNVGLVMPYILTISNNGPQPATNVTAHLVLPSGLSVVYSDGTPGYYDNATQLWHAGTLYPGNTRTLLLNCVATTGGPKKVFAQISSSSTSDPDSAPNNNFGTTPTEDDEAAWTAMAAQVDMELTMSLEPGSTSVPALNQPVTYRVTIVNKGTSTGENTKVRCIPPAGMEFQSASVFHGEFLTQYRVWYVGDIPKDSSYSMLLTAYPTQLGEISYICEVRTCNQPDVDSTPSNYVSTEDDQAQVTICTGCNPPPPLDTPKIDLSIQLTANVTGYFSGDTVIYTLKAINSGDTTAFASKVKLKLPSGFTFVSASANGYNLTNKIWSAGNILKNTQKSIQLKFVVTGTTSKKVFAQVWAASPIDKDSHPASNSGTNPVEDDEAVLTIVHLTGLAMPTPAPISMATDDVCLFPNPCTDRLQVSFDNALPTDVQLFVLDINGRQLLTQNFAAESGINLFSITVSELPTGRYIIVGLSDTGARLFTDNFIKL